MYTGWFMSTQNIQPNPENAGAGQQNLSMANISGAEQARLLHLRTEPDMIAAAQSNVEKASWGYDPYQPTVTDLGAMTAEMEETAGRSRFSSLVVVCGDSIDVEGGGEKLRTQSLAIFQRKFDAQIVFSSINTPGVEPEVAVQVGSETQGDKTEIVVKNGRVRTSVTMTTEHTDPGTFFRSAKTEVVSEVKLELPTNSKFVSYPESKNDMLYESIGRELGLTPRVFNGPPYELGVEWTEFKDPITGIGFTCGNKKGFPGTIPCVHVSLPVARDTAEVEAFLKNSCAEIKEIAPTRGWFKIVAVDRKKVENATPSAEHATGSEFEIELGHGATQYLYDLVRKTLLALR